MEGTPLTNLRVDVRVLDVKEQLFCRPFSVSIHLCAHEDVFRLASTLRPFLPPSSRPLLLSFAEVNDHVWFDARLPFDHGSLPLERLLNLNPSSPDRATVVFAEMAKPTFWMGR